LLAETKVTTAEDDKAVKADEIEVNAVEIAGNQTETETETKKHTVHQPQGLLLFE